MEENRKVSDIEILEDAISSLSGLSIPVDLVDSIGSTVLRVRNNLKVLLDAVHKATAQKIMLESEPEEAEPVPEAVAEEIIGEENG